MRFLNCYLAQQQQHHGMAVSVSEVGVSVCMALVVSKAVVGWLLDAMSRVCCCYYCCCFPRVLKIMASFLLPKVEEEVVYRYMGSL